MVEAAMSGGGCYVWWQLLCMVEAAMSGRGGYL